ncbi:hypothetical protein [Mariniphaga sp.]|uniref:hypothetical protein n=1 Tax=Mariniphaga sp. TaxID=1954475 RepID=UPI00356B2977
MKKLNYFFVFFLIAFLISGCSEFETNQDFLNPENNSELKKAKVPIPAKCWITSVPDFSQGSVLCTPGELEVEVLKGGWMSGIEAQGGKLDTEKSIWNVVSCDFDSEKLLVIEHVEGKHTMMRGDYFLYTGTLSLNITNGAIAGVINVYEGVGRFEGGTAEVAITGMYNFETNVATMYGEGFWVFSD